jgi:hypothetical protein
MTWEKLKAGTVQAAPVQQNQASGSAPGGAARAQAWRELQAIAPQIASDLQQQFSRVFGKPAATRVETDGGEVWKWPR